MSNIAKIKKMKRKLRATCAHCNARKYQRYMRKSDSKDAVGPNRWLCSDIDKCNARAGGYGVSYR